MVRLAVMCVLLTSASACDSDGGRRTIGASCTSGGQCESGLCAQSTCIDPAVCGQALGFGTQPDLVIPCAAGISELALTPDPATPDVEGNVQFTLTGTFASDTDGQLQGEGGAGAPDRTSDSGSGEFALTATADLTAVAVFTSDDPESVTFSDETPGLATIATGVTGRFTITATIERGDFSHEATATLDTSGGGDATDGGSQGPPTP